MNTGLGVLTLAVLGACSRSESGRPQLESKRSAIGDTAAAVNRAAAASPSACKQGSGPLYVSESCVGPISVGMTVAALKATFPGSRDTIVYGQEDANPAVRIAFPGAVVVAGQWEDSLIPRLRTDWLTIRGSNAILFGRVLLSAPWSAFRDSLGPAIADGDNDGTNVSQVSVMFCAHPRVLLSLYTSPDSVASSHPSDLSRIPANARITKVDVFTELDPTWHC
jgi:hypothetical protein